MAEGTVKHVFVNLEDEGDRIVINGRKEIMFNSNEVRSTLEEVAKENGFRCRFPEKQIFDSLPRWDYMKYIAKILELTDVVILFCDFGDVFVQDLVVGYYRKFLGATTDTDTDIHYPMMLINWCPTNSNSRYIELLEEKARAVIYPSNIDEIKSELEEFLKTSSSWLALCNLIKNKLINSSGITMRD
jgi:hypothetical protein